MPLIWKINKIKDLNLMKVNKALALIKIINMILENKYHKSQQIIINNQQMPCKKVLSKQMKATLIF